MIGRALPLLLASALALAACGGDTETTTVGADAEGEATLEADTAAIEKLIVEYGASTGAEGCDFYSRDFLAREAGGLKSCRRDTDQDAVTFTVNDVSVDGNTASVTVEVVGGGGQPLVYPLIREGEPSDVYDGWKLSDGSKRSSSVEETSEAPSATESTIARSKDDTVPVDTPADRADAYAGCIEGRGAKNVKQDEFPSVDFSGGGSPVRAMFGASEGDAEQGLATLKKRNPFFAERFGTVVVYTIGDPLADDLDIGLGCVKEIG
ncbi:MAG: hypothetical protein ACXWES_04945 [Solirubrobacterales bacterium]